MNHFDLEIFLTIVQTKTISSAANALFLSPSAVGARLKALEEELGFSLLIRRKGYKSITLTDKGTAFIPYAEQWLNIWNQSLQLGKQPDTQEFSIGCSSSLLALSIPVYREFQKDYPEVQIKLGVLDSDIAYSLVQQNKVDVGLVMYASNRVNNVITKELFREPLVVAYGSRYNFSDNVSAVSVHDFLPEHQILFIWNNGFEEWYSRHVPHYAGGVLRINDASIMTELFNSETSWAIVPLSVAINLSEKGLANYHTLLENPPQRPVYCIYHAINEEKPFVLDYMDMLKQHINTLSFIHNYIE